VADRSQTVPAGFAGVAHTPQVLSQDEGRRLTEPTSEQQPMRKRLPKTSLRRLFVLAGVAAACSTDATVPALPGPATELIFRVQPESVTAGSAFAPALQVTARDDLGNSATSFTDSVTLALDANPSGGALTGSTTVAAVAGVATFPGVRIEKSGTGYTIRAMASGLPPVTSQSFAVEPAAASSLVCVAQPQTQPPTAGAAIVPPPVVIAIDEFGNVATDFTGAVTVAIEANPAGGTLSGPTTMSAVAGVATFGGLSIDTPGSGYTLKFSGAGLTATICPPFTVAPGPSHHLAFTVRPRNTTASYPITPPVEVTAHDSLGNRAADFTGDVTIAIGSNPGGATLTGTTTVTAVAGAASFPDLCINTSGLGYTLMASSPGLTGAESDAFSVAPSSAVMLAFTTQPSTTPAGTAITPAVQAAVVDALGNHSTCYTGFVTIAIGENPAGGTLTGTATVPTIAGVAEFPDLSIDRPGAGYTLVAVAAGVTSASSTMFTITAGPATHLVCTVPPSTPAGTGMAIRVTARDEFENLATTYVGNVTLTFDYNAGGGGLTGSTTVAAVAGVATFANVSIDQPGSGYTLLASAPGLGSVLCGPFDVTP